MTRSTARHWKGTLYKQSLKDTLQILTTHGPLADFQLAGFFPAAGQMPQSARRRRRELTTLGYVVSTGHTTKSPTGRNVKTWRAV